MSSGVHRCTHRYPFPWSAAMPRSANNASPSREDTRSGDTQRTAKMITFGGKRKPRIQTSMWTFGERNDASTPACRAPYPPRQQCPSGHCCPTSSSSGILVQEELEQGRCQAALPWAALNLFWISCEIRPRSETCRP
jgi:hypothetical protein